jgi:hypothetical protein
MSLNASAAFRDRSKVFHGIRVNPWLLLFFPCYNCLGVLENGQENGNKTNPKNHAE